MTDQQHPITAPELSPAEQVMIAVTHIYQEHGGEPPARAVAAAALLAAADQARRGPEHWEGSYPDDYDKGWNEAVDYFTTIANKLLENH